MANSTTRNASLARSNGAPVSLPLISDGNREEYTGLDGDRKVELLGGFGGKATLTAVKQEPVAPKQAPQDVKRTTKTFDDPKT